MGSDFTYIAVVVVLCATFIWGFHFYFTLPPPPGPDVVRLDKLEADLAALAKKVDSIATAVNMRQLR